MIQYTHMIPWRFNGAILYNKDNPVIYRQMHLHEVTTVSNSVWYDGYRAFLHGKTPDENPHADQTPGYYSWHNGWHCARQDFIEQRAKSSNPARPENSGEQA